MDCDFDDVNIFNNKFTKFDFLIAAPTQSLAQKWLREVHNIDIAILPQIKVTSTKYYWYQIYLNDNIVNDWQDRFGDIIEKCEQNIPGNYVNMEKLEFYLFEDEFAYKTYEEALEEGIKQALLLINNKN